MTTDMIATRFDVLLTKNGLVLKNHLGKPVKIISYSDLHLEFGSVLTPPKSADADLMILAGDIITFKNFQPLSQFLSAWEKPVLFVAGNHEYYTRRPMQSENTKFKDWLAQEHPNVLFLQDEAVTIDGVHFFGGTMWTDFCQGSEQAMMTAQMQMNDFRLIARDEGQQLTPSDTVDMHKAFTDKLKKWFAKKLNGPRVVITHHAPVINPKTKYVNSPLSPAFNSLDMIELIEKHQPVLWVYGHTHECDNHTLGNTTILSNQLGYPNPAGGYECAGFDEHGLPFNIRIA